MKIADIIAVGKISYEHYYNQTMTSVETSVLGIEPPKALVTIAKEHDSAVVVTFGDGTHGIEIDGKTWAHPMAKEFPEYGASNPLKQEVWQYIGLALSVLGKEENLCKAARA